MAAVANGAGGAGGNEAPVGELSYTEASRELDAIVAYFEQRDVDVDQLVARLERATDLVGELDRRLRRTRVQVEQLVPKLAAVLADAGPEDDIPETCLTEGGPPAEADEDNAELGDELGDEPFAGAEPVRRPVVADDGGGADHPGLF